MAWPTTASGDASVYFGLPPGSITWAQVNQKLGLKHGTSLRQEGIKRGLRIEWSMEVCEKAIRAYYEEHGECPNQRSGDCSTCLDLPPGTKTWGNLDAWLRHRKLSLHKLCIQMGLETAYELSLGDCKQAIRAYYEEQGRFPNNKSGDASNYMGLPSETKSWTAVDNYLKNYHGLSTHKLCVGMGLKVAFKWTQEACEKAIRSYFKVNGEPPIDSSGDASLYLDLPPGTKTWQNMEGHLHLNNSSIHKLCKELGVKVDFEWSAHSLKPCEKAIRVYYEKHGRCPHHHSGDASPYLGLPTGTKTWENLGDHLKYHHQTTINQVCLKMGLKDPPFGWSLPLCKEAIRIYYRTAGECPYKRLGDCSEYLDRPTGTQKWVNMEQWLRNHHNTSIDQLCVEMGLKVGFKWTLGACEKAIRSYHEEHGKPPTAQSGDASLYLDLPPGTKTWQNMDQWLPKNHNLSVSKLRKKMGLK